MNRFFCLLMGTALLLASTAHAQRATEQVLYLKNGWVLRGQLLSAPTADPVRLQTADRNEFSFRQAEIDSLRQQPQPPRTLGVAYKARGFGHFTELGALAGRNTSSAVNTSAFSFQIVNGYKFNQWVFTGLGVGADLYATQSLVPVFASLRGDFTRQGTILPFYFLDAGYGFNITGTDTNPTEPVTYEGGTLWAAGVGMKVLFNNNTGFLVSLGYRTQRTTLTRATAAPERITFERIAVRAGFAF
ncbi:hypothetical protein [Hymenobacter arizonensis]|uniref:Outer membrane protein beta-barrel domain-containing protein n=1 Tax=Hymenobacter arizonensis TaxID=1227077 RepID=A0A1I5XW25_HYMAR|nr:hypothetical protein [Hymenobacter arizonensis]SFQ36182.1 hypothetical protein SAMN04515668_2080 [Hymenobacter arizonensis]